MPTLPEFYSDLSYNPVITNLGDVTKVVNVDAIKQSIRTIILTPKGSRIFEPDFGCGIESYLFEPFDTKAANAIGDEIEKAITSYEPRVLLNGITVKTYEETVTYEIQISYIIKDVQEIDNLSVKFVKI